MQTNLISTVKRYDEDAFLQTLNTTYCSTKQTEKNAEIALTETIFFPESGGQPADHGTVTFHLGTEDFSCNLLDVREKEGIIWHTVDRLPLALTPDTPVTCTLDWAHRFDSMQQHSGEHILSGILHQLYGAENVGFHIGQDAVRMDTSCPISPEDLRRAEDLANAKIWENLPIVTTLPTPEALDALTYRSKKALSGQVRIVSIADVDTCACCGTHVRTTGQVGQIRILNAEHYKGGERLSVVCGARALKASQEMRARESEIGALLSAKSDQTALAVSRLYSDYQAVKLAKSCLESRLFETLATTISPEEPAIVAVDSLSPDALHKCAVALTNATDKLCIALSESARNSTPSTSYCLAQNEQNADVRALCKAINTAFHGRGGGKPNICQGSVPNTTVATLETFVRDYLAAQTTI